MYTSKFNVKHDYFVNEINVKYGAFTIFKDLEVVDSFEIKSGLWGKGGLPYGLYRLMSPRVLEDTLANNSFKKEGPPWLCSMMPDFKTERFGICLHPDGGIDGTLGCMGIERNDSKCLYILQQIFKNKEINFIPLLVEKYTSQEKT